MLLRLVLEPHFKKYATAAIWVVDGHRWLSPSCTAPRPQSNFNKWKDWRLMVVGQMLLEWGIIHWSVWILTGLWRKCYLICFKLLNLGDPQNLGMSPLLRCARKRKAVTWNNGAIVKGPRLPLLFPLPEHKPKFGLFHPCFILLEIPPKAT